MKAKVKSTGEIGIVTRIDMLLNDDFVSLSPNEVELLFNYADNNKDKLYDELDEVYWEKLKHQYAGMAMQGILAANAAFTADDTAKWSIEYATTLVEKLKNE